MEHYNNKTLIIIKIYIYIYFLTFKNVSNKQTSLFIDKSYFLIYKVLLVNTIHRKGTDY